MKIKENYKKYACFIINVLILFIAIKSNTSYIRRKNIVKDNKNIVQNYTIDQINCWKGNRGSSTIWISWKGKQYSVSIDRKDCNVSKLKTLRLFYDKQKDILFFDDTLSFRMVIFFYILFVITFLLSIYYMFFFSKN